jgi:hypothetical protein
MTTLSLNQLIGLLVVFGVFNYAAGVVIHGITRLFIYEHDND